MTELEALYEAVLDNPEDDVIRLIYADRLEETGEERNILRAEFIRVQCKLAEWEMFPGDRNLGFTSEDGRRYVFLPTAELNNRELELWGQIRIIDKEWEYIYLDREKLCFTSRMQIEPYLIYRSGFPAEVRCTMGQLMDHAEALSRFPLRKVVITDKSPRWFSENVCDWQLTDFINHYATRIPRKEFEYLLTGVPQYYGKDSSMWMKYSSLEEAIQDLNQAALLYIRSLRQPVGVTSHAVAL